MQNILQEHLPDSGTQTEQTFCRRFRKTVQQYPEKTAVICKETRLTYRELDERSDLLACRLVTEGVKREDIIGIATGRSSDTVVAMLGIWKAGAAYFYLNPAFPREQLEYALERCRCPMVIDEAYMGQIDWERQAPGRPDFSSPTSLALLIFTSGSTAKPKGVMIEHQNIMAMNDSVSDIRFSPADAVCMFPNFSFVASVSDTFPPLLAGSSLYLIEEDRRRDIRLILEYFIEQGITVSFLPPHMAEKFHRLEGGKTKLRQLLVGGENLRNLSPQHYEIRHVYGASEMCSLIADYVIHDDRKVYPVGKVKPGMKYYIIGSDGEQVDAGETGELWLAGPQVSRGYFFDPAKTAKQYRLNPFCSESGYERTFRTGDIVRQLGDGNLQHVGRKDSMFKIRGLRVEAGAIESVLLQYPGVQESVVMAFPDFGGTNILCGYFLSERELDPKAIKAYMREHLPDYMVPACLIRMEDFPRNHNNKVNRSEIRPPAEIDDHKLLEKLY